VEEEEIQAEVLSGSAAAGIKEGQAGVSASGGLLGMRFDQPGELPFAAETNIARAAVDASVGTSGFSFGAGASVVDAALELGDLEPDRGDSMDTSVRAGLGAGVGAAVRGHYADQDGDGIPETGLGADIGPVSIDVKSEALGRASNAITEDAVDVGAPGWRRWLPGG